MIKKSKTFVTLKAVIAAELETSENQTEGKSIIQQELSHRILSGKGEAVYGRCHVRRQEHDIAFANEEL